MSDSDADSLDSSFSDCTNDERARQTTTTTGNSDESQSDSVSKDEEIFLFGISPMFKECGQSVIGRDTVYKVEFKFKNIGRNLMIFQKEITECCRKNNVKGYMCFRNNQTEAFGIMEGAIRDINSVKQWVGQTSDFIDEPLKLNVFFTWFLVASEPHKLDFDVCEKPVDTATDSTGTSRSSST